MEILFNKDRHLDKSMCRGESSEINMAHWFHTISLEYICQIQASSLPWQRPWFPKKKQWFATVENRRRPSFYETTARRAPLADLFVAWVCFEICVCM